MNCTKPPPSNVNAKKQKQKTQQDTAPSAAATPTQHAASTTTSLLHRNEPSSDGAASALSKLNLEALAAEEWCGIRDRFFKSLLAVPLEGAKGEPGTLGELLLYNRQQEGRLQEGKLKKNICELLGRWMLSQRARAPRKAPHDSGDCFLAFKLPSGASSTYDEQLIRDLTLKLPARHQQCPATLDAIKRYVVASRLGEHCMAACQRCMKRHHELSLEHTDSRHSAVTDVSLTDACCTPVIPCRSDFDTASPTQVCPRRTAATDVVQLQLVWSRHPTAKSAGPEKSGWACNAEKAMVLPRVVFDKLRHAFACHYVRAQSLSSTTRDPTAIFAADSVLREFKYRLATLLLRYEVCLFTGGLQFCADTRLKDLLHDRGFAVVDLCASPINFYTPPSERRCGNNGSPLETKDHKDGAHKSPSPHTTTVSNPFCSAFEDTDGCFGSAGNALDFQPVPFYHSQVRRGVWKRGQPVVFTLDVPYDEDLCELLFQKLAKDLQQITQNNGSAPGPSPCSTDRAEGRMGAAPAVKAGSRSYLAVAKGNGGAEAEAVAISWLLVQPLWWDLHFEHTRKLCWSPSPPEQPLSNDGIAKKKLTDVAASAKDAVQRAQQFQGLGYSISYRWMSELCPTPWAGFDCVFMKDQYTYYDSMSEQSISGVTATEVVGLEEPARGGKACCSPSVMGQSAAPLTLSTVLLEFYSHTVAIS